MRVPSLQRLRELDDLGLITVRSLDDLIIANYTPRCAFDGVWDDDTLACRGLILRVDPPWPNSTRIVEVAARPFDKFFNLGEGGRAPASALVEVTEKLDGSLGILFRQAGGFRVATRGAFQSEQALWASEFLRRFDLRALPDPLTLLVEIIYPENRIVVDYAGRAEELDHSMEGWVLRFADGSRFKVKGKVYQQVHRLLNNITPRRVIESMIEGTLNDWLLALPEEFRGDVERWRDEAEGEVARTLDRLQTTLADAPRASRKEFALWVQAHHRADAPYFFGLLDGRDVRIGILKRLAEAIE